MNSTSSRPQLNLARWLGYAALALFAIISLGPIWIAVKTALSDSRTLFSGASSFLPRDPTLFNLQRVLGIANPADPRLAQMSYGKIDFLRALVNSAIFTILAVGPQIAFSAMAAYAFARLRFPGRRFDLLSIPLRYDDSRDCHLYPELHPDQRSRLAKYLSGYGRTVRAHDTFRGLLSAANVSVYAA